MLSFLNSHETMNAFINLMAGLTIVPTTVAIYYALTYDREVVLSRLRRKR